MGWLRLVGSLKLQVSSAEYRLFYRALLQKRRIIFKEPTNRSYLISHWGCGESSTLRQMTQNDSRADCWFWRHMYVYGKCSLHLHYTICTISYWGCGESATFPINICHTEWLTDVFFSATRWDARWSGSLILLLYDDWCRMKVQQHFLYRTAEGLTFEIHILCPQQEK